MKTYLVMKLNQFLALHFFANNLYDIAYALTSDIVLQVVIRSNAYHSSPVGDDLYVTEAWLNIKSFTYIYSKISLIQKDKY